MIYDQTLNIDPLIPGPLPTSAHLFNTPVHQTSRPFVKLPVAELKNIFTFLAII